MKKRILLSLALFAGCLCARAQEINVVSAEEELRLSKRVELQNLYDPDRADFLQKLEKNNGIYMDTLTVIDPVSMAQTVKITRFDFSTRNNDAGEPVYKMADKLPGYPGGENALMEFVYSRARVPNDEEHGIAYLQTEFDDKGNIVAVSAWGKAPEAYLTEILRAFKTSKGWTPAQHKGQAVRCEVLVPMEF